MMTAGNFINIGIRPAIMFRSAGVFLTGVAWTQEHSAPADSIMAALAPDLRSRPVPARAPDLRSCH